MAPVRSPCAWWLAVRCSVATDAASQAATSLRGSVARRSTCPTIHVRRAGHTGSVACPRSSHPHSSRLLPAALLVPEWTVHHVDKVRPAASGGNRRTLPTLTSTYLACHRRHSVQDMNLARMVLASIVPTCTKDTQRELAALAVGRPR